MQEEGPFIVRGLRSAVGRALRSPGLWRRRVLTPLLVDLTRDWPSRIGNAEFGTAIRRRLYRSLGAAVGDGSRIMEGVRIYNPRGLRLGCRVTLGAGFVANAEGGLSIGDDVFIGPGSMVWTVNHDYTVANLVDVERYICRPVTIEDNVWLGAGVRVVPGVTIERGAVAAMGAILTCDVESDTLVVGVPARAVKKVR